MSERYIIAGLLVLCAGWFGCVALYFKYVLPKHINRMENSYCKVCGGSALTLVNGICEYCRENPIE